jgi:hypothetical protein
MTKTSNSKSKQYVVSRIPFRGSNMFGKGDDKLYIVYSYGNHFPLHVWNGKEWYSNCEKYSVTTSRHFSQTKPVETILVTTNELNQIIKKTSRKLLLENHINW